MDDETRSSGVGRGCSVSGRALRSWFTRAVVFKNCYTVRGTADARNPKISTERALNRLHHHIAHEMRSPGGKTVGPTSTHCIRNACEASAIVCRHQQSVIGIVKVRLVSITAVVLATATCHWSTQSAAASPASSWHTRIAPAGENWHHYYRRHGDQWRRHYRPPAPQAPARPLSCGEFRFWDGERCVDVRFR